MKDDIVDKDTVIRALTISDCEKIVKEESSETIRQVLEFVSPEQARVFISLPIGITYKNRSIIKERILNNVPVGIQVEF